MGEGESAVPCKLSGLRFYNQRESREGKESTFFLILERHQNFIISFPYMLDRGVSCPYKVKPGLSMGYHFHGHVPSQLIRIN